MNEKFLVDGMLGTLARKLRIFGYDVVYKADIDDGEALEAARREGRIILTSDRALSSLASRSGIDDILLTEESDEERLITVFRRLGGSARHPNPAQARCPVCNGEVDTVGREGVKDRAPENVIAVHEEFYICRSCGKAYWMGSHWRKILDLAERVERRLQQA